jgi:hypothetical protein
MNWPQGQLEMALFLYFDFPGTLVPLSSLIFLSQEICIFLPSSLLYDRKMDSLHKRGLV